MNVFAGRPNVVVAKVNVSFQDAGITVDNTAIIYMVDAVLKSYRPERTINAITGFQADKGYYMVPKVDIDLSTFLVPPLDLPSVLDPLTVAYLAKTGITDAAIINKVDALSIFLRANNIIEDYKLGKGVAVYPFKGGTEYKHSINLLNPDADQLIFHGGWIHDANGATPNGTDAYADTGIEPENRLAVFDSHVIISLATNNAPGASENKFLFGSYGGGSQFSLNLYNSDKVQSYMQGTVGFGLNASGVTNFQRVYLAQRVNDGQADLYIDNTHLQNLTADVYAKPPRPNLYINALNNDGVIQYMNNDNTINFFSVGDSLTPSEWAAYRTQILALNS